MGAVPTVIDSPVGPLTVVAGDGALTGLYFPDHLADAAPRRRGVRRGPRPARGVLRRRTRRVRPPPRPARRRLPATRLAATAHRPIVPCHRVVGADGTLAGFAGGLPRKRFLLTLEEPTPTTDGRLF